MDTLERQIAQLRERRETMTLTGGEMAREELPITASGKVQQHRLHERPAAEPAANEA